MSGIDLCPKCRGLHFRNAPCIVRKPKLEETKCNTTGTSKPTTTTSSGAISTVGIGPTSQQDNSEDRSSAVERPLLRNIRQVEGSIPSGLTKSNPTKRGPGRPKTITDMRAYKAEWARRRRAEKKAGKDE